MSEERKGMKFRFMDKVRILEPPESKLNLERLYNKFDPAFYGGMEGYVSNILPGGKYQVWLKECNDNPTQVILEDYREDQLKLIEETKLIKK